VKVYGGQPVKAGGIIFRQTGSTVSAANGAMWLGQGQATAATAVFMAAAASKQPLVRLELIAVHHA
jgi:ribosomal protein L27